MDRTTALTDLSAEDAHRRLLAARYFQRSAEPSDRDMLLLAVRRERDRWVRLALRRAVAGLVTQLPRGAPDPAASDQGTADLLEDLRARATEQVSKSLVHEIRPILGGAKQDASREIPEYASSATRRSLERLGGLIEALEQLSVASSAARQDEFDLGELIEVLVTRAEFRGAPIEMSGRTPLVVLGDPARVELVVANALRNAVEALAGNGDDGIVVSWEQTDTDVWVAVIDNGVGLATGTDQAFEIGTTTKSKAAHYGMGLSIAREAARSLDGTVSLVPREEGGARFELRWPGLP